MYGKYFVLFAILFTGWFLRKINFIDDKMNRSINKLIVYFAYPCMIVHNIGTIEMSGTIMAQFLTTFFISLAMFYIYGAITYGYSKARKLPAENSNVVEFAMCLPNDGFMGFPVAMLFFGETGLLFMLAHNAAMNFFTFTYGLKLMRRNESSGAKGTPKGAVKALFRLITNPNIIALVLGFILSLCGGNIPEAVDEYLVYLGNISTPMAMIFIGSTLTRCRFLDIIKEFRTIEASFMKLVWLPIITLAAVYFLPITPLMKCAIVLGCSFPTAATVSMLAEQENQDEEMACKILFLSTVVSAASIPGTINLLNLIFM